MGGGLLATIPPQSFEMALAKRGSKRPDIAAAKRAVAAANAQIGIQRPAYFPSLSLSGSVGNSGSRVADLFGASTSLWSLGLSVAQTLFDAGATRARVEGAEAPRDAAIARYRQTVLTAFQGVEDQLPSTRSPSRRACAAPPPKLPTSPNKGC